MDQISRRQVVQGAAAAVAMTLGAPSVRAQKDNQILRFGAEADLKVLDPVWTTAYVTRNHGYLVYDTLLGTDESFRIKPQMVDRTVVSSDGMKYTFRLRDGLQDLYTRTGRAVWPCAQRTGKDGRQRSVHDAGANRVYLTGGTV
jgi:peptide/nickel transport system substrate-binding protein